ncbi:MAG TPA: type I polyketide synthase, partial [Pseudonocardiaceae bacterium]|nr:type I polyketide synthase [Pseudonocardiaceae bacterium]
TPASFIEFSRQRALSPDGRCKAFSSSADGVAWGEGVGVVVLERLSDAIRNGRKVLAVVRGSAVNQDGVSNGMTAPNAAAQREVITLALADARLDNRDVDAVEAHGTGTTLGDPIEADSIIATYGAQRDPDQPLWLGSVKSNLGHTQAAAGVAGVIKMVQALQRRVLPVTINVEEPTPHVDWSAGTVRLLTEPVELTETERPLRAGISSFGLSGTNAHVIIEAPPAVKNQSDQPDTSGRPGQPGGHLVWPLSAKGESRLRAHAGQLLAFAETATDDELVAAGHKLTNRAGFSHRAVVVAADRDELVKALAAVAAGETHGAVLTGVAADEVQPVFVFPGQGSQWVGMAVELYESNPVFREQLQRCDEALRPYTGWSVVAVLRAETGAPELEGTEVIQPTLFAVMVSLAAVWRSVGVEPAAVLGHSQGEIAGACVSGALALEDAAKVVALRAQALVKLRGTGGMLTVSAPAEQVRERISAWSDQIWVAVHSGPSVTVVAGDVIALDEFTAQHGEQVQIRRIAVDYASHTPHVEAIREDLLARLEQVSAQATDITVGSSLTGALIEATELGTEYWYENLRNPVRFEQAIGAFKEFDSPLFIEVSPHPVLRGDIEDIRDAAGLGGGSCTTLRRNQGDWTKFVTSVAQAYALGARVDWAAVLGQAPQTRVELPTYPFERRHYWVIDSAAGIGGAAGAGIEGSRHPLLTAVVAGADDTFVLTGQLSGSTAPWLADHAVEGNVLLPGAAFVELALQAGAAAGCDLLEELTLEAPLVMAPAGSVQLQITVDRPDEQQRRAVTVFSRAGDGEWVRRASGSVAPDGTAGAAACDWARTWPPAGGAPVDAEGGYEDLADRGYGYGPAFRGAQSVWHCGDEVFADVAAPEGVDVTAFGVHPAVLDASLHPMVLTDTTAQLRLPFVFRGVRLAATEAATLRVRLVPSGDDVAVEAADAAGRPVFSVESLRVRAIPTQSLGAAKASGPAPHGVDWVEVPVSTGGESRLVYVGRPVPGLDGYPDVAALASAIDGGTPAPDLVVFGCAGAASDAPEAIRELSGRVLEVAQAGVTDDHIAGSG